MEKKKYKVMENPSGLMQLYLKVNRNECPTLTMLPLERRSYPANLIPLQGCVVESTGNFAECEDEVWKACQKVSEMCQEGAKALVAVPQSNAMGEHLAYAYSILCDYLKEFDGDYTMSKETAETLIRGAIDRIVWAGKCSGFELDKYRSDDKAEDREG